MGVEIVMKFFASFHERIDLFNSHGNHPYNSMRIGVFGRIG
jgi:hypothetical protein